ncbi:MAG: M48 family metallopeptidase [Atopobiaceae bacterium]|nr:M48 family metallopeptidase [Atopobiaceae bacterium]
MYELMVDGIPVLVTHKRVKNVNVRIGADGAARMSVPVRVSRERAERIAHSYAGWFRTHLERAGNRRVPAPQQWQSGERLMVWGSEVTLLIEESRGRATCELVGPSLVLRVPADSTPQSRERLVEDWLRKELRTRLQDLVPLCEERVGKHASSITLRRMKTRWGSCTTRTASIRLNTALAECPPACLEMVLVHELCHLWEANHGRRFHMLMDLHCPDWRVTQRWLNEHQPRVLEA